MLYIPSNPTIHDFQKYVRDMEEERGFDNQESIHKCLLLGEEVGELFKAVRKYDANLLIDSNSSVGTIQEELADILIYLCAIANKFDVNLEQSFRDKEEKNKTRTWSSPRVDDQS